MGILRSLFTKPLTAAELRPQLNKVARERRRRMMEMRKLGRKREKSIDEIRKARKSGDKLNVDYLWEELKQLQFDAAFARREAKVSNLEEIALKRYLRALEKLEKAKDTQGVKNLFAKIRSSGLEAKLAEQRIREQEYLDELNAIVAIAGEELREEEMEEDEDKAAFLEEIDKIIEAEDSGKEDVARKHREALSKKLEAEIEE
jgi:hypothetical protein